MEGGMAFLDEALDSQALFAGPFAAETTAGRRGAVPEPFHGRRLQESSPSRLTF